MRELVVISGKGGTGKTSLAAALAVLARDAVVADCDVDAPDLHLVLSPRMTHTEEFYSGHEAIIREDACTGCGRCVTLCRQNAIARSEIGIDTRRHSVAHYTCHECTFCKRSCEARSDELILAMSAYLDHTSTHRYVVDPSLCEGCGVCVRFCPSGAIDFVPRHVGEWMVSHTRCGVMVHAQLCVGADNSGKLVSCVRREAKRIAEEKHSRCIIVDGPPGIGCPVIASITGASHALLVAEPTSAGEHDLMRVLSLIQHFGIPAFLCVNKWDMDPDGTSRIEQQAQRAGIESVGRIRFDPCITQAQLHMKTAVETGCPSGEDIAQIWDRLERLMAE